MMKITGFPFSTEFERSFHRNHRLHPYFIAKHANAAKTTNGCCSTFQKSSKWGSCLNLSSIPTKAEELHVKVDEKSRTLTVSGKSETESNRRDGVKIFSTHVWTKDIRIPEEVELKTIASKLRENKLTFVAERVQKEEDKQHEIPIEIVDTPALD
jgi:hypothetical protein